MSGAREGLVAALCVGVLGLAVGCAEPIESRAHRPLQWDMSADSLAVPKGDDAIDVPREAVRYAWRVEQSADDIDPEPARFVARSRGYWMKAGADQLAEGLAVPTTSPGAMVKVQPLVADAKAEQALAPAALTVIDPAGEVNEDGAAMAMLAGWDELADEEVPLPTGTSMFVLDPALGAGQFQVKAPTMPTAAAYLVHVHEPDSDAVMELWTDRDAYLLGDTLKLQAQLAWAGVALLADDLDARVLAPGGEGWAFELHPQGEEGHFVGTLELDSLEAPAGALFDVEVCALAQTETGHRARRCARTAFAYAVPTARIDGEIVADAQAGAVTMAMPVEVAAAGRYAVSGLVYGTDTHGVPQPVGVVQSADFLEEGRAGLTLEVGETLLAASGLSAPWSVQDLRLVDQGRLGVLQRHTGALSLPDPAAAE